MPNVWKQIASELGSSLEPRGFRRSRLTFIDEQHPEVIRTIAIVKFRWNVPGQQRFQLVLSLYLATGQAGEFTFTGRQARYSLVFQKNVGYLWGDEAFLFLIPDVLPDETFSTQLRGVVEGRILTFLEGCTSIDGVVQALDEEDSKTGRNLFATQLGIALARLGRMEESRQHFLRAPGATESVRQLAVQYGVKL
jgi:hypothetical protein